MTEPLLSLTELAAQLQRPRMWIWRLVHAGQIPFVKIGRSYYFRVSEVEHWISQQTATPQPRPRARSLGDELKMFGLSKDDFDAVN